VHTYEWALLRVVPRVDRGEMVNAGVVLYCGALGYLAAEVALEPERVLALDPAADVEAISRHLDTVVEICAGTPAAGPLAKLSPRERFGWLVAPRSTVVQPSPVHTGLTDDPAGELQRLMTQMVHPPTAADAP
jgi:hypothetical protein